MIRSTFIILKGIGKITERKLWDFGILTWENFLEAKSIPFIPPEKKSLYDRILTRWKTELDRLNEKYFFENLPRREHWRLFQVFKGHALYLDIETTGLSPQASEVTVVGLCDGERTYHLIKGRDLTRDNLQRGIEGHKILVTFYGSVFDLPLLRANFPGLNLDLPHFDLCFAGRRVGLKGGLKQVERILGIHRDPEIRNIDGFEAVKLWYAYERGDRSALDLLLKYNLADTLNLVTIAGEIYRRLREKEYGQILSEDTGVAGG